MAHHQRSTAEAITQKGTHTPRQVRGGQVELTQDLRRRRLHGAPAARAIRVCARDAKDLFERLDGPQRDPDLLEDPRREVFAQMDGGSLVDVSHADDLHE